jgi:cation diffusion facilitator family transporter
VTPQRRTALVSVLAALALVVLKLATGLATGSLGLVSEAVHSGTDLVAALLTFFAVGVAARPADMGHPYGHGKAEHLAALAEAAILVAASLLIAARAVSNLVGASEPSVDVTWYALAVIGLVILIDASRAVISQRAGRRYRSAALQANAIHFAGDLAGSVAVLAGLLAAAGGYENGDSLAALFVAALVLLAAGRLARRNVDVLMDRAPPGALEAAEEAIAAIDPPVELRRLRLRQAAGRHFADVVIGVPPGAVVGQGHAAADAVEAAVHRAVPESDVVVHVEPSDEIAGLRERVQAAALSVPRVREIHNLRVLEVEGRVEVSLHLKLPGGLPLAEAHDVAEGVERAIEDAIPEVGSVQTHIEPLREVELGSDAKADDGIVAEIVRDVTGAAPREVQFRDTDQGLVAFVTVRVGAGQALDEAHERASEIEARIREARPEIADVVVHTEP